ncbi:hypothetical protein JHC09_09475 [Devosia sp. MC532]|uniref:hypothetical protein n=1 Tax=Devosia sp. MC532 TaxID=2799788 RepID=UPI0018F70B52|nr:hypothetical protein [Devosia sp. MC532]MBJ7578116.1 hypothetical protein [Devosia sp. MC532]
MQIIAAQTLWDIIVTEVLSDASISAPSLKARAKKSAIIVNFGSTASRKPGVNARVLADARRVVEAVIRFGDVSPTEALNWMRTQKLPGYNKTAIELIAASRADAVLATLNAVEVGVHA